LHRAFVCADAAGFALWTEGTARAIFTCCSACGSRATTIAAPLLIAVATVTVA
jgi:hypothetical protein